MDLDEYRLMYQVELQHWWYLGMEKITRTILDKWYAPHPDLHILDAGCGTGAAMSTYLAEYGRVTGFDLSPIALHYCQKRGLFSIVQASIGNIPFTSQCFDLITSFDVLYERGVVDDCWALNELARLLVHGGRLFLRLPAYNWLHGQHDEVVHTARRYTSRQIKDLLKKCGLMVEHISYANTFLFPLAMMKRIAEKVVSNKTARSDLALNTGSFNDFLKMVLSQEAKPVAYVGLPFGLSLIAVGKKL